MNYRAPRRSAARYLDFQWLAARPWPQKGVMAMLAVVRILGLSIGILLGMLLMAAIVARAEAQEFPAEVRFLQHLPLLMEETECLEDGKKVELIDRCEIRVADASPGQEKAIYIVIGYTDEKSMVFVVEGALLTAAVEPPRDLLPDEAEVFIRGKCGSVVLKIAAPTRCDMVALRGNGQEIFYLRLYGPVPGGILFSVLPGKLIFPSSFLFFKK